jgi:hypothetical protein
MAFLSNVSILCRFRGVFVCINVIEMFKNKKLMRLMISLAITLLMASGYLFSLQLMNTSQEQEPSEEVEQEVQVANVSGKESSKSDEEASSSLESKVKILGPGSDRRLETAQETKNEVKSQAKLDKRSVESSPKTEQKQEVKMASPIEDQVKEELKLETPSEVAGVDSSKKYRPRIIGRCKVLFDRFNKVELQPNQYHAFAYSFDGKSGYCADSGTQASMKLAKEIALSDCEKNKASAESYAPCFIYSIEK